MFQIITKIARNVLSCSFLVQVLNEALDVSHRVFVILVSVLGTLFLSLVLNPNLVLAQVYQDITPAVSQHVMGACGQSLPIEKSRQVTNLRLVCGGAKVQFPPRQAIMSPYWDEWNKIDRSEALLSLDVRKEMQALRLKEEPLFWKGMADYPIFEEWTWKARFRGKNRNHCRVWKKPRKCMVKGEPKPIKKWVCVESDEDESADGAIIGGAAGVAAGRAGGSRNLGQGSTSSGGRDEKGGTEKPKRKDGPDTGKMDPAKKLDSYDSYKDKKNSSGSGASSKGGSSGGSKKDSNRRSSILDLLIPSAYAQENCGYEVVGYEDTYVEGTCYDEIIDECEWDEDQTALRSCGQQSLAYKVQYQKPPTDYQPGAKGYHDLLPNKYDLLPGEWEQVTFQTNPSGRQSNILAHVKIENAWNEYEIKTQPVLCRLGGDQQIEAQIVTKARILRRAPNSLAESADQWGRVNSLVSDQRFVGDKGDPVRLRPHRIQLVDKSDEVLAAASRQSRKTTMQNPYMKETPYNGPAQKAATALDFGFWKNTLLKIKIVEKNNCLGEGEKIFADVLQTTTALTKFEGNHILVPLTGDSMGLKPLYRPFGRIGKVVQFFVPDIDLQLNPGMDYEFRISMVQQGLPFYENGCVDGSMTCDATQVHSRVYSDELRIQFKADPRVDDRGWIQKFENWYGRKVWNKFLNCGK